MLRIASKTRVIASLAGPFNKYSNNLVTQCVEAGTHYLDITGENIWVRDLIDKHHEAAEKKQIKIIPSCGYDSIPSDMGCFYLQRSLNQELQRIDGYHRGNGGVVVARLKVHFPCVTTKANIQWDIHFYSIQRNI